MGAGWKCFCRGPTQVKGKGTLVTYFVQPPPEGELSESKGNKICGAKNEDCGALLRSPFALASKHVPLTPKLNDSSSPNGKEPTPTPTTESAPKDERPRRKSSATNILSNHLHVSSTSPHPRESPESKRKKSFCSLTSEGVSSMDESSSHRTIEGSYNPETDVFRDEGSIRSCETASLPATGAGKLVERGSSYAVSEDGIVSKIAGCEPLSYILMERPLFNGHLPKRKSKSEEHLNYMGKSRRQRDHNPKKRKAESHVVLVDGKPRIRLQPKSSTAKYQINLPFYSREKSSLNAHSKNSLPKDTVGNPQIEWNCHDKFKQFAPLSKECLEAKYQIIFPKSSSKKRSQVFV